jgi:hypothetical protein
MERSPESIRTKIVRVMKSYKKANDRFNGSGHGLEGIDYANYHEKVLKETCRFYDDLHPILGERPNVTPWVTNEDIDDEEEEVNNAVDESDESDNDMEEFPRSKPSDEIVINLSNTNETNVSSEKTRVIESTSSAARSQNDVVDLCASNSKSTKSTVTDLSSDDHSECVLNTTGESRSSKSCNQPKKKNRVKEKSKKKQKLSPLEAKSKQQTFIRKNKKQINSTKTDPKIVDLIKAEQEEREFMMESRQKKLDFEFEKHNDLKRIESNKIRLDEKRLEMEHSQFVLKKQQIQFQMDYEKNRVLLQKMEMFKRREELKKTNPNITDELLDKLFPMP